MSNHPISQPTAKTFPIPDLVAAAHKGQLRVPEFQRPLRWQWRDVQRLFDSIVKGYPIGNLLLWSRPAPAAHVRLGALRIDAGSFQNGLWVVDGQQRLISLANALSDEGAEDPRFALSYDLERQIFVRPSPRDDGHLVPLPVLFDLTRLIRWFGQDHPEVAERLDEAARLAKAIREYQVPAYLVEQEDEAVLRDIFDRMNNYGKRLSRAEVFSALHPGGGHESEPYSPFAGIAEAIHAELGFGLLDDDTVLRAVLARRAGDVTRDIRVEFSSRARGPRDFVGESPETAYREGEVALSRAVRFLQKEARIPHFAFLPYRYVLVVLTRFFAHFPEPKARNLTLLRRWLWRATMTGPAPFNASYTSAMRRLTSAIVAGDESGSIDALLKPPVEKSLRLPPLTNFRTNAAASRVVLTALWDLAPCSLLTGEAYEQSQLTDVLSLDGTLREIARPIFRRESDYGPVTAANRIFVLEDELPETIPRLLQLPPAGVERETFLPSHALDADLIARLEADDKPAFLEGRLTKIEEVVKRFLTRMAEPEFEDTRPLDEYDLDDLDSGRDDALA